MKKILIISSILLGVGAIAYFVYKNKKKTGNAEPVAAVAGQTSSTLKTKMAELLSTENNSVSKVVKPIINPTTATTRVYEPVVEGKPILNRTDTFSVV
jgi:uncharacterized membrane protein YebE (DUF533 family)